MFSPFFNYYFVPVQYTSTYGHTTPKNYLYK